MDIICMCEEDLAFSNPQGLICHKTQPNQTVCKQMSSDPFKNYVT